MTHYPKAYTGKEPYIFISYAHKDSDRVLSLIRGLTDRGFRVWYDAGIEAATEWPEYIAQRLVDSSCVLAFLSGAALDSHNCRREINFAIEMKKDPLVVYLEDVELSFGMRMQLGSLQAIYYTRHGTDEAFLEKLAEAEILQPCKQHVARHPAAGSVGLSEEERQEAETVANTWVLLTKMELEQGKAPDMETVSTILEMVSDTKIGVNAVFQVGALYEDKGYHTEALKLFAFAGEMGHAMAAKTAAFLYLEGQGAEPDYEKTAKYIKIAAEGGDLQAQGLLGKLYEAGIGLPKSLENAIAWYEKAGKFEEADRCRKQLG